MHTTATINGKHFRLVPMKKRKKARRKKARRKTARRKTARRKNGRFAKR